MFHLLSRRSSSVYPKGQGNSLYGFYNISLAVSFSFTTLEDIVATRLSLLSTIKQREKRDQLGDLESPILSQIKNLEKKCLLKLSGTARAADKSEVALNAITRAKTLESTPSFEVLEELSNVLWLLKEHKPAAEGLRAALSDSGIPALDQTRVALALSRLVHSSIFKPLSLLILLRELGGPKLVFKSPLTFRITVSFQLLIQSKRWEIT